MADIKDLNKQYAGRGLEDMSGQDYLAPFLNICQSNSPQVQEGHQAYIKDIRPGMIFNTQSQAFFKDIKVIPVRYTFRIVEWKPREQG